MTKTMNKETFKKELEELINRYSMENGSNTPDFLLADYLIAALDNYNEITTRRDKWYGHTSSGGKSFEIGKESGWGTSAPNLPEPPTDCSSGECSCGKRY
jgi:hypothetical protein